MFGVAEAWPTTAPGAKPWSIPTFDHSYNIANIFATYLLKLLQMCSKFIFVMIYICASVKNRELRIRVSNQVAMNGFWGICCHNARERLRRTINPSPHVYPHHVQFYWRYYQNKIGTHDSFWIFFKMTAAKSEISNISEITSCRMMIWG